MPAPSDTLAARPAAVAPRRPGADGWARPTLGIGLPLLVGLIHVALVWPRYHVGSFDDDASFVLSAKALLAGGGLSGHLPTGDVVAGLYPPGYSALIAPLVWAFPHTFTDLRALSTACYAAVFPLTWVWLGRRGASPTVRAAVLAVLALGPPFATYGSMVMAEAPFVVVLLLLLLAVDGWAPAGTVIGGRGAAVALAAAALVWLKQAGIGLDIGLLLWLLVGRHPRRAAKATFLAACLAVALSPVVVARLADGVPLAGSRYSLELGGFYQGGLVDRLVNVVPTSAWHLLSGAIPATFVPYLAPLPIGGHWPDLWKALSWHVTLLAGVGAVGWARRHRDPAVPMIVVYLAECVLWPFVNERRAVLVAPVLVAWYVLGAVRVGEWAKRWRQNRAGPRAATWWRAAAVGACGAVVFVPLAVQMPRDYLFGWGQSSSRFEGSRYVSLLRHIGPPSAVVETDYRSTTALFSGHPANWSAFTGSLAECGEDQVRQGITDDNAAFLLNGDFNKPGWLDSDCADEQVERAPWAVPLLHTTRDDATVYELVGPGTANPELEDPVAGRAPTIVSGPAGATGSLTLAAPTPVVQVSLGEGDLGTSAHPGRVRSVQLQLLVPGVGWRTVARAASAVGTGGSTPPFLLVRFATPVTALGVRAVVTGTPPPAPASGTARDRPGRGRLWPGWVSVGAPADVVDLAVISSSA